MDTSAHSSAPSDERRLSAPRLIGALLLSGVFYAVIGGMAYASFVAFALLEGVGIPVTACLGLILAVKTQQATVSLVTSWRPPVLVLVLAGLPAGALVFALHQWLRPGSWLGSTALIALGLMIQSVTLHRLSNLTAATEISP